MLNRDRKTATEDAEVTKSGRLFQTRADSCQTIAITITAKAVLGHSTRITLVVDCNVI